MEQNKVRFPDVWAVRAFESPTGNGVAIDLSVTGSILEELLVLCPSKVLVEDTSIYSTIVDRLPTPLSNWVEVVDGQKPARAVEALLRPVFRDFGEELMSWSMTSCLSISTKVVDQARRDELDPKAVNGLAWLPSTLYPLFFGIEYECTVEVELRRLLERITLIRANAREADAQVSLALLEGIVRSYQATTVDGFKFHSNFPVDKAQTFRRFVEDETYKQLTSECYGLAIPERTSLALARIRTQAERLIRSPRFSRYVTRGTKMVATVTQKPLIEQLVPELSADTRYLPVVASFDSIREQAGALWMRRNLSPIPPNENAAREIEHLRWLHPARVTQTFSKKTVIL